MFNIMCQLVWAVVSRYIIKHYSGCFCEGIFAWDWHLNQCPLKWGWASTNQLKVLIAEKTDLPQTRRNSAAWPSSDLNSWFVSSLSLQPARLICRIWICQPPEFYKPIFKNTSVYRRFMWIYSYTTYCFFLPLENPD